MNNHFFSVIDSFGKINSGIFNGNLAAYGNFEECMDINEDVSNFTFEINGNQFTPIEVPAFKGQYLLVTLKLSSLGLKENSAENQMNLRHHGDYNLALGDPLTTDLILVSQTLGIFSFLLPLGQKPTFYPKITKNLMLKNVIFVKNETLKM